MPYRGHKNIRRTALARRKARASRRMPNRDRKPAKRGEIDPDDEEGGRDHAPRRR